MNAINVFWFRRDLRWHDNCGLNAALKSGRPVLPIFIFDSLILNRLQDPSDLRVQLIHRHIQEMCAKVQKIGGSFRVYYGSPEEVFRELAGTYSIETVYTNHDYEPYARNRDQNVRQLLQSCGIGFETFKDQVLFEKSEVTKDDGGLYSVYTPYSRKWRERLEEEGVPHFASEKKLESLVKRTEISLLEAPPLQKMGFEETSPSFPDPEIKPQSLQSYETLRNQLEPARTTRAGAHLRFGLVSPRELIKKGREHSASWLNELIWREFFMMVLYHYPHTVRQPFRSEYAAVSWRHDTSDFEKWAQGQTGYPLVDAGIRELRTTGYMHNRVRMVVGSFLTKHLLLPWQWGERFFAKYLLDFELASNVGNWQWVAGCGCDAAPYFRIFNPATQLEKFDPNRRYVNRWVPEWDKRHYSAPIVDHKMARQRALRTFKEGLKRAEKW